MATPALAAFAPSTASSTNGKASRGRRITILSQNKVIKLMATLFRPNIR